MNNHQDRERILRAIKKCLSNAYSHCQEAMDSLDEIGKGSLGTGMTPLVGGFAMSDPKDKYRAALIEVDKIDKSLKPLVKRYEKGIVNKTHFSDAEIMKEMEDIAKFDYDMLVDRLKKREGRESVWYRLRELSNKIERVFKHVAEK